MNQYIAIAAASFIGLAGIATAAEMQAHRNAREAQFSQHIENGGLPRDLQDLNLSSRQKAQIQKILETNRPVRFTEETPPAEDRRKAFRTAEQNLVSSKTFDETAARRLIEERRAEHEQRAAERKSRKTEMEIARLKTRHDIFQILTAKQQKQWLENPNNRPHDKHGREHMQHGR